MITPLRDRYVRNYLKGYHSKKDKQTTVMVTKMTIIFFFTGFTILFMQGPPITSYCDVCSLLKDNLNAFIY